MRLLHSPLNRLSPSSHPHPRNLAYRHCLRSHFLSHPGDSLLDVGAGTGILALYAARAGQEAGGGGEGDRSSAFVACETNPCLARIASEVARRNGLPVRVVPKLSVNLDRSDAGPLSSGGFDVLVTETFDAGLLGEHCLDVFDHAWRHLLRPGAKVVPRGASASCFLLESRELRDRKAFDRGRLGELRSDSFVLSSEDLSAEPYDCEDLRRVAHRRLSDDVEVVDVDFADPARVSRLRTEGARRVLSVRCRSAGSVDAVAVWFRLRMGDGEGSSLSTRPEDGDAGWQHAIFPLRSRLPVAPGTEVEMVFEVRGHLTLLDCKKKEESVNDGCEQISGSRKVVEVPESFLQRANDVRLLEAYARVGGSIAATGRCRKILDCDGFAGLLSLHLLRASPTAEASFYFADPATYASQAEFLFAVGRENDLLRPEERIHGEFPASVRANGPGEPHLYDLVVWSPVSQGGVLEVSAAARDCLGKAAEQKRRGWPCAVLPSAVEVRCRLFRGEKLRGRFRADPRDPSTSEFDGLARELNGYGPSRLRDVDFAREPGVEFLSACTRAATLVGAEDCLGDLSCEFDFDFDGVPGDGDVRADGVLYWCDLSYGEDVVVSTWSVDPDRRLSSFRQAAFLFDPAVPVGPGTKGVFRLQSGLVEIDVKT